MAHPSFIDGLIDLYMGILDIRGPRPRVVFRDRIGSTWNGQCVRDYEKGETLIELQKALLADLNRLERTFAHEMIHHRDFLVEDSPQRLLSKLGRRVDWHGSSFMQGAAVINQIKGKDFVTETSDRQWERMPTSRKFFLLVVPAGRGYHWQWAARLSPDAKKAIEKSFARGARLVMTDDEWLAIRAPHIGRSGWAVATSDEKREKLGRLYAEGTTTVPT